MPSRESSPETNSGLGKRQPIELSTTSPGLAKAREGFSMTHGARDIDSTPPATTTSASPARTIWEASMIADIPEAHRRLTVRPGTESGYPASSQAIRATLRFSSPAPLALPRITSSTTPGSSIPARSRAARRVSAARSSGRTEESAPPYLPTGVRAPPTRNACSMPLPSLSIRHPYGSQRVTGC